MTDDFAGKRQDAMQDVMTEAFHMLKAVLGIHTIGELKRGNETWKSMLEFSKRFPELYIYGAGVYGQACAKMLGAASIEVKGYVVTKKEKNIEVINQLPVKELSEFSLENKKGIIIAVNDRYRKEIIEAIHRKDSSFRNLFYFLSSRIKS